MLRVTSLPQAQVVLEWGLVVVESAVGQTEGTRRGGEREVRPPATLLLPRNHAPVASAICPDTPALNVHSGDL